MTKQEFIELFEVVQQYHEQSRELGEMLHKTLFDGHSVVCFGSKLQEAYIKLLHDVSGVPTELIEQLLYEGSFSMWIGFEGEQKEYRIVTAEDLWEANEAYCALFISSGNIGKA
ncbi:MAG: hypothetical protein IIX42_00745 [Alistipes sp.]|nr:hypothetical protein [Alistipes sp.]